MHGVTILARTWVDGLPKTKGSVRGEVTHCPGSRDQRHGIRMVETVDNGPWRALVGQRVQEDYDRRHPGRGPVSGYVMVTSYFALPPVVSNPDHPGIGDIDKLGGKLILDAIAGLKKTDANVITDDVMTVLLHTGKMVAYPGDPTGALIVINELSSDEYAALTGGWRDAIDYARAELGESAPPPMGL